MVHDGDTHTQQSADWPGAGWMLGGCWVMGVSVGNRFLFDMVTDTSSDLTPHTLFIIVCLLPFCPSSLLVPSPYPCVFLHTFSSLDNVCGTTHGDIDVYETPPPSAFFLSPSVFVLASCRLSFFFLCDIVVILFCTTCVVWHANFLSLFPSLLPCAPIHTHTMATACVMKLINLDKHGSCLWLVPFFESSMLGDHLSRSEYTCWGVVALKFVWITSFHGETPLEGAMIGWWTRCTQFNISVF